MKQIKIFAPVLPLAIAAALLQVLTLSTACSVLPGAARPSVVVLHPIAGDDIIMVDSGAVLVAPKSGAFVSDFYIKEVMKARVGR